MNNKFIIVIFITIIYYYYHLDCAPTDRQIRESLSEKRCREKYRIIKMKNVLNNCFYNYEDVPLETICDVLALESSDYGNCERRAAARRKKYDFNPFNNPRDVMEFRRNE